MSSAGSRKPERYERETEAHHTGRVDNYRAYVQRVAAEMERNGYERLCVARGDVTSADIAAYKRVLDEAQDERPIQKFLQENPGMLAQQLGAVCRWIIPQPRFGANYVPDFIAARLDSGGLNWTLVELESPTVRLFTKDGRRRKQLDKGIRQIGDWREWIAAHRSYVNGTRLDGGLGFFNLDHRASGLVLIGRRANVTDQDRQLMRPVMYNERIDIHSYDWLVDEAHQRMRYKADLARSKAVDCEDCVMPGRSFQ